MPSEKQKRSIINMISLIGFFGIFSTTVSKNPVLSLYVQSLGGNETVIGLIAAISPLAGILFSFPVGMLSDRLGKKRLLIVSAVVFAIAPLLYLVVNQALWLIPIRFFHGIATAILGPVASAVICGAYPETKGEKLGLYSSATLIGRTIAPLVGGVVISGMIFLGNGLNYKAVYLAAFLAGLPVLILTLLLKDDESAESLKKLTLGDFAKGFQDVFRNRKILGTALVEMAAYFTFGAFETYLPVYLAAQNYPAYQIGILFSIQVLAIALSKPFFGKLSDRVDRRIQITAGILILGAALLAIPVITELIPVVVLSILFGLGMSLSTVATSTYVADVAKKESLGASLGALSSIMDIGHSSGPFVAGMVIAASSVTGGFLVCFIVCAASAVVFLAASAGKELSVKPR